MSSLKVIILILLLAAGCTHANNQRKAENKISLPANRLEYAEKFTMKKMGDLTELTVFTPWQNGSALSFRYLVVDGDAALPDSLREASVIRSPVKKVVVMSTTFVSFLDTLGVLSTVKGISGSRYIYNSVLAGMVRKGVTREVGFDNALNYEAIIDIDPDVLFLFGVQSGIVQSIRKLEDAGIPVILCADYLEPLPLGRTEWIKFFSVFFGKEDAADTIFKGIEENYIRLASFSGNEEKPGVLLGLPWKDSWYIAGGKSFAANLVNDAGGRYMFSDIESSEAEPLSIEKVFLRGIDADYWINPGVAVSRRDILDHDPRFEKFRAFRDGKVYNNNKRMGEGGGNDYWESGILHPDRILEDLVHILHDSVPHAGDLYYYRRLD